MSYVPTADSEGPPPIPERPASGRATVILAGVATALSLLGDQALYAILPIHYESLGLSKIQVGILLSVNRFVRLLTNHLAAWLVHHIHSAFLFVGVLVLASALAFTYGLWPPFAVLVVARVLWGLCWSMIRQMGTMTSIRVMPGQQVGRTVGLYSGLSRAGSIAGLALGGFLFDELGMRLCFFTLAGLTLLGVAPGALIGRTLRRLSFKPETHVEGAVPRKSRSLLVCGFILGCMGYGIVFSKLGHVLKMLSPDETVDFNSMAIQLTTFVSVVLCLRHVIGLFLGPSLGRISDHLGHRRATFLYFTGAALLLGAAAMLSQHFWAIVPLMIALFFFTSALIVTLMAEAGNVSPGTFAWLVTALDLGGAVGPLLAWTLGEWVDQTWMPFAIAGGLAAVAAAISLRRMLRSDRGIPVTI